MNVLVKITPEALEQAAIAVCQQREWKHPDYRDDWRLKTILEGTHAYLGRLLLVTNRDTLGLGGRVWARRADVEEILLSLGWMQAQPFSAGGRLYLQPPAHFCRSCPKLLRCSLEGRVSGEAA